MIELERQGEIFTLRMRDGENRFTNASLAELGAKLDEVVEQAGDGPAGLVVVGEDKYWSNGIDLAALSGASAEEQQAFLPALHALLGRMVTFPLPTVAALNGHCFAGGAILAMAFDHRVMRTGRGWVCFPEIDIAVPFTGPMLALLRAKLRADTLRDAILGGRRYTAEEALAAGMVDAIGEPEVLAELATQTLAPLSGKARATYARFKRDLYGSVAAELGYEPG